MAFELRDDRPVPDNSNKGREGGRNGKYPWHKMQPGQHFFVPNKKVCTPPKKLKDQGYGFTTERGTDENGVEGLFVYRRV